MAETIFSKIIAKQIPAKIAYEDDRYIVIHDREPKAPVHLLVIPKKAIATLNEVQSADAELGIFGPIVQPLMGTMLNAGA